MKGITSILHISDLHRSKGAAISNAALLSSLVIDKNLYTERGNPHIKQPDIAIVSGDIIRGSTDPNNSDKEIQDQYNEAEDFLDKIAAEFFGNDRSRIIIIPGNHDVDWGKSFNSMTRLDNAKIFDHRNKIKKEIMLGAINTQSNIRFSFSDMAYYEITDPELYNKRMEAFANFYNRFYGVDAYPIDPAKQFHIHDLPLYNLTVAAFSSCYCNDHLRLVADFHPDCVGNATLDLRKYEKKGRLLLGTWHHNTKGRPYDMNFMDASKLKNFINAGIVLGFHGHQHKSEIIAEHSDILEQQRMIVLSAGTLCGSAPELPPGVNRQYNLVEINWDNPDGLEVTVHVREKTEDSSFDNPIWRPGRVGNGPASYYSFKINLPQPPSIDMQLQEIDKQIKNGKYKEAEQLLLNLSTDDEFVRKFLVECITHTGNLYIAYQIFMPPLNIEECVCVLQFALESSDKAIRKQIFEMGSLLNFDDAVVKELLRKLKALL